MKKPETPFYINIREGEVITIGDIPVRVNYVEKRRGVMGQVGLAVDPPDALSVTFDAATRTLKRLTPRADVA